MPDDFNPNMEDSEVARLVALIERIDELAALAEGPEARAIRVRCAEALCEPIPE
jgi:hypothetical protein